MLHDPIRYLRVSAFARVIKSTTTGLTMGQFHPV